LAVDIASGSQPLNGSFLARAAMYARSGRGTFWAVRKTRSALDGATMERRVLGVAEHCDECAEEASRGWVPIGTLTPIGGLRCLTNCKCQFEYSNGPAIFSGWEDHPIDPETGRHKQRFERLEEERTIKGEQYSERAQEKVDEIEPVMKEALDKIIDNYVALKTDAVKERRVMKEDDLKALIESYKDDISAEFKNFHDDYLSIVERSKEAADQASKGNADDAATIHLEVLMYLNDLKSNFNFFARNWSIPQGMTLRSSRVIKVAMRRAIPNAGKQKRRKYPKPLPCVMKVRAAISRAYDAHQDAAKQHRDELNFSAEFNSGWDEHAVDPKTGRHKQKYNRSKDGKSKPVTINENHVKNWLDHLISTYKSQGVDPSTKVEEMTGLVQQYLKHGFPDATDDQLKQYASRVVSESLGGSLTPAATPSASPQNPQTPPPQAKPVATPDPGVMAVAAPVPLP
jgi:predicted ArsR family transcriptional regulator